MDADLVVVGGGPGGLSAAAAAAQYGLNVVLVEERPDIGGSLTAALNEEVSPEGTLRWMIGRDRAAELAEAAVRTGVRVLTGTSVWGIWPDWVVYVDRLHDNRIHARSLVLATGTVQRSVVSPGWTLPGVMAPAAIQRLLHIYRVRPGLTAIVVGPDWLGVLTAWHLMIAGVRVLGILLPSPEAPGAVRPQAAIRDLARFAGTSERVPIGRAARSVLSRTGEILTPEECPIHGISWEETALMPRRAVMAILGSDEVTGVEIAELSVVGDPQGYPERWEVDTVVLSGGLAPLCELPQLVGCRVAYVPELGGTVPIHGPNYETTVSGVFVAGSITGIVSVPVAVAQGRLAGTAAAAWVIKSTSHRQEDPLRDSLIAARQAVIEVRAFSLPLLTDAEAGESRVLNLWHHALASGREAPGGEKR
jgi:sarcosine oxidase subunit alpha